MGKASDFLGLILLEIIWRIMVLSDFLLNGKFKAKVIPVNFDSRDYSFFEEIFLDTIAFPFSLQWSFHFDDNIY